MAERLLGAAEAYELVEGRAQVLLDDLAPSEAAPLPARKAASGGWRALLPRWR